MTLTDRIADGFRAVALDVKELRGATSTQVLTGVGSFATPYTFMVARVAFSDACRVRVYQTAAARDQDETRPEGTAPANGMPAVVYEYIASEPGEVDLNPAFIAARLPDETGLYYRVTGAGAATLTIKEF